MQQFIEKEFKKKKTCTENARYLLWMDQHADKAIKIAEKLPDDLAELIAHEILQSSSLRIEAHIGTVETFTKEFLDTITGAVAAAYVMGQLSQKENP